MTDQPTEPTIEEQRISQHADTLNALAEMQHSIAYAARRSVLADAERIIAELEHENKRLHANFGLLQAEANLAQAREVKWRDVVAEKITDAICADFHEWDAEADQYSQQQQDSSAGEDLLRARIIHAILPILGPE